MVKVSGGLDLEGQTVDKSEQDSDFVRISIIVMFPLSLVGNGIAFIVLVFKKAKMTSYNVYMIVIAVSDTMVIVNHFIAYLGVSYFTVTLGVVFCKMSVAFQLFFSLNSNWVRIALTLERVIAVHLPFKARDILTKNKSWVICVAICAVMAIWVGVLPYQFELVNVGDLESGTVYECSHKVYENPSTMWIITHVLSGVVPFILISIANTLLLIGVKSAQLKLRSSQSIDHFIQIARNVIAISVCYIVFSFPMNILNILLPYLDLSKYIEVSTKVITTVAILQNIATILFNVNFCINVGLYFYFNSLFRQYAKEVFDRYSCRCIRAGFH